MFGNAPWILKTAPQTSSPSVSSILLCLYYFPISLLFFIEHSHTFHVWKCALYPESIAQHHHQQWAPSPFLSWEISPILLLFFICKSTHFYLEVDTGPWKQCPMLSPTVSTTAELTNAPYSPAWMIAMGAKKMTSFLLELGPLTPLQTRKIYPYHISFTKYILRPCWHKNIFPRCDSDISGSTHQKYILTAFHW